MAVRLQAVGQSPLIGRDLNRTVPDEESNRCHICSCVSMARNKLWVGGAKCHGTRSIRPGLERKLGRVSRTGNDWGRTRVNGYGAAAASAADNVNELGGDAQEIQFAWPDSQRPRICILGGGFGGLYTALNLDSLLWPPDKRPQIVLVDQGERFLFKPMLYELLVREAFSWEIAPRFEELIENTGISFLKGSVASVSPSDCVDGSEEARGGGKEAESGRVLLGDGTVIAYDWLVSALGAETVVSSVPGAKEFAYPFGTLDDAERVEAKLQSLERRTVGAREKIAPIRVLVVGAGFAGVELASTVAERLGNKGEVQVVAPTSDICPAGKAGSRDSAKKALLQRKVNLKLGYYVRELQRSEGTSRGDGEDASDVITVKLEPVAPSSHGDGGAQELDTKHRESGDDAMELEADLVLWTVGTRATVPPSGHGRSAENPLAFPVNARGQINMDDRLRVQGHPRVFALGDTAGLLEDDGSALRATAQVAIQQANYVGWNIWAAINDRPLLPFRYVHMGEIMTLGAKEATVSIPFLDDLTLDGRLAQSARKLVYLNQFPTLEHKVKVGLSWLTRTAIDTVADVADLLLSNSR